MKKYYKYFVFRSQELSKSIQNLKGSKGKNFHQRVQSFSGNRTKIISKPGGCKQMKLF